MTRPEIPDTGKLSHIAASRVERKEVEPESVELQSLPIGTRFVDPESGEKFEIASRDDCSVNDCDVDIIAACEEGIGYTINGFYGFSTHYCCAGDTFRFPGDLLVTEFEPPEEDQGEPQHD